jgi:hypothetical protein
MDGLDNAANNQQPAKQENGAYGCCGHSNEIDVPKINMRIPALTRWFSMERRYRFRDRDSLLHGETRDNRVMTNYIRPAHRLCARSIREKGHHALLSPAM